MIWHPKTIFYLSRIPVLGDHIIRLIAVRLARQPMRSRWVYGIQRRTVYLVPPTSDDMAWLFECFKLQEISNMFGYREDGFALILQNYSRATSAVAIIKLTGSQKRIGFLIMYAPTVLYDFWEFGYALPNPADRNAFNALNATDAGAHYMFEHLGVPVLGWRTRSDNQAADAVVRRLGYKAGEQILDAGHQYTIYRLDQAGWKKRIETLKRQERTCPAFYCLPPPFDNYV